MATKLNYEQEVEKKITITAFVLSDFYKGAALNSEYIDFHNSECPCCENALPKYGESIVDVGAVSGFYSMMDRAIFMYALCKECANEMVLLAHRPQAERLIKAQGIEQRVLAKKNLATSLIGGCKNDRRINNVMGIFNVCTAGPYGHEAC